MQNAICESVLYWMLNDGHLIGSVLNMSVVRGTSGDRQATPMFAIYALAIMESDLPTQRYPRVGTPETGISAQPEKYAGAMQSRSSNRSSRLRYLTVATLCSFAIISVPASSQAPLATGWRSFVGTCLFTVDGRILITGRCQVDMSPDGDFSLGSDGSSPFFGYFERKSRGTWRGLWNGSADSTHAHDELGDMQQYDAFCLKNKQALACVYGSAGEPVIH
ncbi:hypothetical protein LGR54_11095 [Ancylobacter sp. Lp-2]|uniref:hypothetical protein n=1 Tax=Ancylobacter sp. Lp-2 TaxID=2881339 RepID=UPI001E324C49|nr:hypothetical protein [Ancylobacter sp. Lp-2]MCB4769149.1 hypothetical protein [Ancylobacter sp. Lp-2]